MRFHFSTKQGSSVTAQGEQEIEELLCAVLGDGMDCLFVAAPQVAAPQPFVVYADPDQCATFYPNSGSNLNRVTDALWAEGLEEVWGYQREGLR